MNGYIGPNGQQPQTCKFMLFYRPTVSPPQIQLSLRLKTCIKYTRTYRNGWTGLRTKNHFHRSRLAVFHYETGFRQRLINESLSDQYRFGRHGEGVWCFKTRNPNDPRGKNRLLMRCVRASERSISRNWYPY